MARKIAWNIAVVAVGALIGLWLFDTCFLKTDKTPQAFDRYVVSHMVPVIGIALLVGAVA